MPERVPPLKYLAQELGVGDLSKLSSADRETLKRWAEQEQEQNT